MRLGDNILLWLLLDLLVLNLVVVDGLDWRFLESLNRLDEDLLLLWSVDGLLGTLGGRSSIKTLSYSLFVWIEWTECKNGFFEGFQDFVHHGWSWSREEFLLEESIMIVSTYWWDFRVTSH